MSLARIIGEYISRSELFERFQQKGDCSVNGRFANTKSTQISRIAVNNIREEKTMNTNNYTIRRETENDYKAVELLTREAFWNQYTPGCHEHYFVHVMRTHADFIPELALVLEKDGEIIGNVMYTKSTLRDADGNEKQILSFGPLSVAPQYQRQGCGKALLEYSFQQAIALGYDTIAIFGNPGNYVGRGFKSCKKHNVCLEGDFFPTALLVKELIPDALDGRRWYFHPSPVEQVCEDETAVAEFDSAFEPKEKRWQPSQEEFYIYSHSVINR